jgi:alpha-beta hydrolase superfamily lysophospholipase
MQHKEYRWELDGKKVFAQAWLPGTEPRAIINLIHGLGEHSGRYAHWGKLFAEEGFAMLGMDLFGNGQTEGRTAHVRNYQLLLDQVDLMLARAEENFPGVPRILYGHSLGGNIAINYAISKDPPVSALIASSPWLRLSFRISPVERSAVRIVNAIVPGLRIGAKGVHAERLSHDPEHWEDVRQDPLNHNKISIRYLHEVITMGEYAIENASRLNIPFLLIHGDADEITSHKASEELVANISGKAKLKIWEGLRHELHNEFEQKEVFRYVKEWIGGLQL